MTLTSVTDRQAFKDATRAQWDRAAKGWNEHGPQIRAWLRDATAAMINMAGAKANSRVLDIAAGAGDLTLELAERVGPGGFVLATDLSGEILELDPRHSDYDPLTGGSGGAVLG